MKKPMKIEKRTWKQFRDAKLLWWINLMLHWVGWVIVVELNETGEITDVYPARVDCRGFDADSEAEGFVGLTSYLRDNSNELFDVN